MGGESNPFPVINKLPSPTMKGPRSNLKRDVPALLEPLEFAPKPSDDAHVDAIPMKKKPTSKILKTRPVVLESLPSPTQSTQMYNFVNENTVKN